MDMKEAMHFLSSSRAHVKEAVISPSEDDPFSYGKFEIEECLIAYSFRVQGANQLGCCLGRP